MGKSSDRFRVLSIAGMSALLVVGAIADGTKIERSAAPEAVQTAIKTLEGQGAKIGEVELETEDGKPVYSVELTRDGKETEVDISPDGKVMTEKDDDDDGDHKDGDDKDEEEIAVEAADVPAAVKAAIEPLAKGATIDKYTKETEDGAVAYEAEFTADGKECSVKVAEDGTVVEIEKHADALPTAAADAVKKKYPAATIKKTEAVELHFYEVKVDNGGKSYEIKVDATGSIIEHEEDHED